MTDTAYCYPAPYWPMEDCEWIKSLLLFFDDIAILLPDYMYGRHTTADPTLARSLEERGLLKVLEPKIWIDAEMTEKLFEIIIELLANGTFDKLPEADYFAELSQSRIGYSANVELAGFLVDKLQAKGLAQPSEDGVSVPLHPVVRTTILVILGQLSRIAGEKRGMTIHPTTNNFSAAADLIKTLSMESMPSRHRMIQLDLEPVTFDLTYIPLEDVLQFRADHQESYRAYMRDLHGFTVELARIDDPNEREKELLKRRQQISDMAHDIQRSTRSALGKNLASWYLGITSSAWSLSPDDPIGLALSAISLIIPGIISSRSKEVSAYSYIFHTRNAFGRNAGI